MRRKSSSVTNQPRLTNYHQVTQRVIQLVLVWSALLHRQQYWHLQSKTQFAWVKQRFILFCAMFNWDRRPAELQSHCPNTQGVSELSWPTRQAAEYEEASVHVHVCVRDAQISKRFYQKAPIYSLRYTCAVGNKRSQAWEAEPAGISCNISSPEVTLNRMRERCVNIGSSSPSGICLRSWLKVLLLFRQFACSFFLFFLTKCHFLQKWNVEITGY